MGWSPERFIVADADAVGIDGRQHYRVEAQGEARGPDAMGPPGSKSRACAQGSPRNLGGLDASDIERNGRAERKQSKAGAWRSRSAAVGAKTRGNRPEGPRRAKGGTGTWTRWRE